MPDSNEDDSSADTTEPFTGTQSEDTTEDQGTDQTRDMTLDQHRGDEPDDQWFDPTRFQSLELGETKTDVVDRIRQQNRERSEPVEERGHEGNTSTASPDETETDAND